MLWGKTKTGDPPEPERSDEPACGDTHKGWGPAQGGEGGLRWEANPHVKEAITLQGL